MKNNKKIQLATALVIPAIFALHTEDSEAAPFAVKNIADPVNIRSEAKMGDNVVGLVDDERPFELVSEETENEDWLQIKLKDGKKAYVYKDYFKVNKDTKVLSAANFRKEGSLQGEIIQVVKAGERVEVLEGANEKGFVKVKYNDKEGFISYDLLEAFYKAPQKTQKASGGNKRQAQNTQYSQPAQKTTYTQTPAYTGSSSNAKEIIAQRESGGSYYAQNGQYYGRYQLSLSYLGGDLSPANQERVADNYVYSRYGSWENALTFRNNNGWY